MSTTLQLKMYSYIYIKNLFKINLLMNLNWSIKFMFELLLPVDMMQFIVPVRQPASKV